MGDGFRAANRIRCPGLGIPGACQAGQKHLCEGPTGGSPAPIHEVFVFFPLRCRSVELNLNQVHVEETPKRKGTKVFGSLEKGLDKVITVLTRSKRKGSVRDGPRRLKVGGCNSLVWILEADC